jgi:predicted Zn-dependent peptidase
MKNKSDRFSSLLRVLLPAALTMAIAIPASAQAGGGGQSTQSVPLSQVERKNRAPINKEVLQPKIPKPSETTLPNGLTVLILEDHRLPMVNVQLQINGSGGLCEPTSSRGLAGFTAQLLREGTATRTSKQIAEDIDRLGASFSATATFTAMNTGVNASGLSENFDQWMPIVVDSLLHPSFPASELEILKQRTKAGLQAQRGNAAFLALERFNKAVYGDFPAATMSMTVETVDALKPETLAQWHHDHYLPQNTILAISGDVQTAALLAKLKQWFGEWQKTDVKPVFPTGPSPATMKRVFLVDRPNSVQTNLYMGNIAIDRRSPDYYALNVLNRILGGSAAARLFMNLRENKGYTYGAYSSFTAVSYAGAWNANSEVRTDVTDGAMTEFLVELNRIRDEKVPTTELEEAKRSIVASFALSLESPQTIMGYAVTRKIFGFADDYWDKYPAQIMGVTADDVQRVAQKYVNPATMQIVAVGDGTKIKSVMEKYGPVEVYSTEGKPAAAKSAAAPGTN